MAKDLKDDTFLELIHYNGSASISQKAYDKLEAFGIFTKLKNKKYIKNSVPGNNGHWIKDTKFKEVEDYIKEKEKKKINKKEEEKTKKAKKNGD